jgi:ankyrin repeat protein
MPNKYNIQAKRQHLDGLIRDRAWNSFRTQFTALSSNKENCRAIVECRHHTSHRTLLHAICDLEKKLPPADIIKLIASLCPRALFTPDCDRRLPLHLAICHGYGIEETRAILESAPDDDELYSKQKMVLSADSSGMTPLLTAVKRDASANNDDVVKYLINQDLTGSSLLPSGTISHKKNKQKSTAPLKYAAAREILHVDGGLESRDDLLCFIIIRTYRAIMNELMKSLYSLNQNAINIESDDAKVCLLQAAITCHDMFGSSKMALSVISAIIRQRLFHPNHVDSMGNSTLHIACLSSAHKFDQVLKLGQHVTDYGINSDDCTLMEYLIKLYMHSFANFVSCNNVGDIPLHCAIRSGKDCVHIQQLIGALEQSAWISTRSGELPIHLAVKCGATWDVIMLLWRAFPEALLIQDASTGMHLFQLVTVMPITSKSTTGTRETVYLKMRKSKTLIQKMPAGYAQELEQLSLAYFFLRERPEAISLSH